MRKYEEKRKHARAPADLRVQVEQYSVAPMHLVACNASSENLSAGGIFVRSDRPFKVSSTVLASFTLPGKGDFLEVAARTVRCEEMENGYGVGLEFIDCGVLEFRDIEKFVKRREENRRQAT